MDKFGALDPQLFMYTGVFLGALVLFEGVRQMILSNNATDQARSARVKLLHQGMAPKQTVALLRPKAKSTLLSKIPFYGTLTLQMRQAGMLVTPAAFLMLCAAIAGVLFAFVFLILGLLPAVGIAILSGIVIPICVVKIKRKKRIEKFTAQLPDALEIMMRGLRVGHPLNTTIENVAKNMPDPISTEFGLMADQITYGDDLTTAMFDLAHRIDQEDMHYLAVSVSIQHGTGGNLGKMLGTLSKVIRRRFAMRRKVKALSAEGRMSAIILSALPIIMYVGTSVTAPHYYRDVMDDPLFLPIAATAIILVVSNYLMLRKLVNFRL